MPFRIAFIFMLSAFAAWAKCPPQFQSICAPEEVTSNEAAAPLAKSFVVSSRRAPEVATPSPRWLSPYRISQLAFIGAAAADISSSWGCAEANPLLRSADGRFRAKGLAIKAGFTASGLIATHLLRKKFPKMEKPLTFMMGGTSTFLYATAFRNHSMPCY